MRLHFHALQVPNLRLRVLFQIENLVLLVTAHHIDGGLQCGALFLLHQQGAVRAAQQARGAGNHLESIPSGLLPGVVDGQHADTVLICKLFELADDLIVAGVAVRFAAHLPDFLHGVNDNEFGVRVFPHEVFQLLVQTVSDFSGSGGKMEIRGIVYAIHHKHPVLDALEVILQRKVEDGSLVDFAAPQLLPGADMVGNLRHQKRLANLGRTSKEVRSRMEQIFNDGRAAFVGGLK